MAKSKERLEARKLRRLGESMGSIKRKLGVSKSSVSLWCSDIELTKEQYERLIVMDRKGGAKGRMVAAKNKINERLERLRGYLSQGKDMVGDISDRELLLVGTALYWAEGNKKNRRVTFTNSDPKMIKICIRWLKKCLKVPSEDIYCYVGINQMHSKRVPLVEKYWSDISKIPLRNFRKASLKKVSTFKVYENPEKHFGTLNVKVKKGTNLSYLILGLIAGLGMDEAD